MKESVFGFSFTRHPSPAFLPSPIPAFSLSGGSFAVAGASNRAAQEACALGAVWISESGLFASRLATRVEFTYNRRAMNQENLQTLDYTPEVQRATRSLYERVRGVIPEIEWPVHAPYIARINEL